MRHLPALLLTVLAASAAQAATITVNSTTIGNTLYIPQFNPALGTLQSVSGELTGFATYRFTFNGPDVANVSYDVRNFFGIYTGPTFFDGTLTRVGVVNIVDREAIISTTGTAVDVRSTPVILTYFTGTGEVTGSPTVDLPFFATFTPNGGGISNVENLSRSGSLAVTYTFEPFGGGVIPEPGTWALMLAGFTGAGMALRRRRQVTASAG